MSNPAAQLANTIADILRRLRAVERAAQMRFRSIEGGAMTVNDDSGTPVLVVGKQTDGGFAVTGQNGGTVVANGLDLPAGSITETDISDGAISTPKLAANAVTADVIAAGAVTAAKLDAGAVTADKLSADAIDGKTITGATIIGGEINTTSTNGSQVHITTDPTDGAVLDLHPTDAAGHTIDTATIRSGTDPVTALPSIMFRGPNIDGNGVAEMHLSSQFGGGTATFLAHKFAVEADGDINLQSGNGGTVSVYTWNPSTSQYESTLYVVPGMVHVDSLDLGGFRLAATSESITLEGRPLRAGVLNGTVYNASARTLASTTGGDVVAMTFPSAVTLVAGRAYLFKFFCQFLSTVAGDEAFFHLRKDSATGTLVKEIVPPGGIRTAYTGYSLMGEHLYLCTAVETFTPVFCVSRLSGSGTISVSTGGAGNPAFFLVEDVTENSVLTSM